VETVVVAFSRTGAGAANSDQVFHGGWGTVAVPGVLDGIVAAHERHGQVDLAEVLAPGTRLALGGVDLSPGQRTFLLLVEDLLALTDDSRRLWDRARRSGHYANPQLADVLREMAAGAIRRMADPGIGEALLAASRAGGGLLSASDLRTYAPALRPPHRVQRGESTVWTGPSPGGAIVAAALERVPESGVLDWTSVVDGLVEATVSVRSRGQVSTGTTHLSVVDRTGRLAALTLSNGSGSGAIIPGWGVTLNNMLGEEDLRPADGSFPPAGTRMGSMMAPTLVRLPDGSRAALGSGGSERIRSAILATTLRLVDEGRSLADAVGGPRVHATESGPIHVEPGLGEASLDGLSALAARRGWPQVEGWPAPNLYFGGVHAVQRAADGSVIAVGDRRRTGSVGVLLPDGTPLTG
jgi:gamma-glutamyltranspeptidase/glutathione hydrolase